MIYQVAIYVTASGTAYGASQTDQAYTRAAERTVAGRPAVYAGRWYGIQMRYRPYRKAVETAAERARALEVTRE
jgi:hypothetical protein